MKRLQAIITLCICLLSSVWAQEAMRFTVRHYSAADGLSQNIVMSILEDADGFMWFGTWDGLNRFDGQTFKVYKPALSGTHVASNRVDYLYEDSLHFIWLKTNDGAFYRLNKHTETMLPTDIRDTRFSSQQRHLILEQQAGVIWLAGGCHLLRIEESRNGSSDAVRSQSFTLKAEASCIVSDASGTVWVGTDAGVERFAQEEADYLLLGASDKDNCITAGLAQGQTVYFGTAAGSIWHTSVGSKQLSRMPVAVGSAITFITALDDRRLIFGTEKSGFGIYDTRSSQCVLFDDSNKAISSNHFISAYVDQHRTVWLINEQEGVLALRPDGSLTRYLSQPDNNYRNLQSLNLIFAEDKEGHVYINPYGGGFAVYSPEEDRLCPVIHSVTNIVHSAYVDSRGSI